MRLTMLLPCSQCKTHLQQTQRRLNKLLATLLIETKALLLDRTLVTVGVLPALETKAAALGLEKDLPVAAKLTETT